MKLSTPRLGVLLDDGTEHDVQTTQQDAVRFDIMRPRLGWPGYKEAPMLWTTFLAWSALRRAGVIEQDADKGGLDRIVGLEFRDDDGNPAADADAATPDPTAETA